LEFRRVLFRSHSFPGSVLSLARASVCDAGASDSTEPGQDWVPTEDHCSDSLGPPAHAARSTPPVLSTWPVSWKALATPSIVVSTSGITPSGVQVVPAPFTPTSEVSNAPLVPPQVAAATVVVCVTISCPPGCSTVPCGQMSQVHVLTFTITESTVTAIGALLTRRTAPASKVQFGVQPAKPTDGEPSHGVGKLAGFARRLSAYPTKTCT